MPNARVGAMPHSQAGNDVRDAVSKKKTRKKGITMEDLKQQTAARLAKDQRRRNATTNRATRGNVHDHSQISVVPSPSMEMSVSCDNSVGSSSYHNSPHMARDDFPHARFDFSRKDTAIRPVMEQQADTYHSPRMQVQTQQRHHHQHSYNQQGHQHFTSQKYHGHNMVGNKHSSQNYLSSNRSTHSVGSGSASSKLPHGLTVQELKEMTKARLAQEAAHGDSEFTTQQQAYPNNQQRTRLYSHESRDNSIGRHPVVSTDSFGSYGERQRLNSAESFGSVRSAFTGSGYHSKGLLSPSLSHEQPPLTSFSYDNNMDNESYASAMGSESILGLETVGSKSTKYSNVGSVYRIPYSSEKATPSSQMKNVTASNERSNLWSDPFPRSNSPVPTVANSTTSFGQSEHETSSFFTTTPLGKMERMISAGAVVPNAVAESVLGNSDDGLGKYLSELDGGLNQSSSAFVSPEVKRSSNDHEMTYRSPWANDPQERYNENDIVDHNIAKLQSDLNTVLNFDNKSGADDFPLSTFTSKGNSIQSSESHAFHSENPSYLSPFQTVPEERVIQNLSSRNVNVPESFIDEPDEDLIIPKIGGMMRRKMSRN